MKSRHRSSGFTNPEVKNTKGLKRALIWFLIAIGLLYLVRAITYEGVNRSESGEFEKLRTTFREKNNFDLIVIGSSRAECQFYTPVLDSITGLSCYNIGMTGATMPFVRTTLEAYLVNSEAPKYVVLNLDLHSLSDGTDTIYNFARYFPYLDNVILYEGLNSMDHRFVWFRWLPFYSMPYFNKRYLSNSLHGWLRTPTQFDADYIQGFAPSIPNPLLGDLDTIPMIETHAEIPPEVWNAAVQVKNLCDAHGIRLIFAVTPLFHRQEACVTNYEQSKEKFRSFADAENIGWIDFGHDSMRFEKQFYSDPAHLNKAGAQRFTRIFSAALLQYLDK